MIRIYLLVLLLSIAWSTLWFYDEGVVVHIPFVTSLYIPYN